MRNVRTTVRRLLWPAGVPSLLIALLAAGCAEPPRQVRVLAARSTYGASGLRPGDTMPDLSFLDADGKVVRLGMVRGRVTAIMFPDNPDEWPNPEIYRRLDELAKRSGGPEIPVAIVNIGRPKRSWEEAAQVLEAEPVKSNQLILVADKEGDFHRSVGSGASGKFYVLDNYNRITEVGEFTGVESLREPIKRAVRKVAEEDSQFEQHG